MDRINPGTKRALSLDLARGSMLLLIILAHVPLLMYTAEPGVITKLQADSFVGEFLNILMELLVDNRARPLFAVLFGYGLVMVYKKQVEKRGIAAARKIIIRRCLYLILFGAILAGAFNGQDILMTYGIAGLILLPLVYRKTKAIVIWTIVTTVLFALYIPFLWGGFLFVLQSYGLPVEFTGQETYFSTILDRAVSIPIIPIFTHFFYPVIPSVLMGFWLGHLNVMIEPDKHVSFLKKLFIITISISVIGAIPLVTINNIWYPEYFTAGLIYGLHIISGLFAGLAYAAFFGLLGVSIKHRNIFIEAMSAMGKRSLSFFVLHEILIVVFLSPIVLNLGAHLSVTSSFLFGIGMWLVTLIAAYMMEQKDISGPLEIVMRKITYK